MTATVIYHSADFDGIFCREIARKFMPDAELIGWTFGDPPLHFPTQGQVYVMDLPLNEVFNLHPSMWAAIMRSETMALDASRTIWIDHHKSSIDSHPTGIPGYRIDGVAACRLAWQWFVLHEAWDPREMHPPSDLPSKGDFDDRTVTEPLAVRLAGEYDIWDKRDPRAEVFQFGLRSDDLTDWHWQWLLDERSSSSANAILQTLLDAGLMIQRYQQQNDESIVGSRSFIVEWEGLKFLALTTARCNSLTFAARDMPETGHDALMGFYFNGSSWIVSLYHASHRTDLDLSTIAVKYGGGGHRGACGFQSKSLPFLQ